MAELVSVRTKEGENSKDKMTTVQIAIENPAFANDTEDSDVQSKCATNGPAKTDTIPAATLQGTTISFHNVKYTVEVKVKRKKVQKEIVKGISGIFTPGMNAILGPTGCGKTTTLDMLADRKDMSQVTGDIMVNGTKKPSNFKRMTGYVVQHDVVMGLLTVRENIYFSASLRLPSSMTSEEKAQKVDKLIDELGLSKVADSKVGNEVVRGISGGEKRRTGIGMELITSPHVLFLDEPTTGLDASTASSVMQLLHDLSRKGNTIIFSIHQPRYSIFKLFDNICLLGDGHMMYNGPAQEALGYFEEIGYQCEPHNNPPDFFLDVINSAKLETADDEVNDTEKGEITILDLARKFKDSAQGQAIQKQVTEIFENMKANPNSEAAINTKYAQQNRYATGWFKQMGIVGQRSVRCLIRNPLTTIVQFFVMAFLGLVVGALYFKIEKDEKGIQNRVGAFFFIIMNMVYANLDSIELLIKEKSIFVHESASGYYRVSVYFLAKIFAEFLPYRALSAFLFAIIVYWMAGFDSDAGKFFIFVLTLVQVAVCGTSFAFLFSATFGIFAVANLMAAVLYTIMLVFGGLLLNQESFGDWIGWFRYLSIFKYGLECLEINELDGMEFTCPIVVSNTTGFSSSLPCLQGSEYLVSQGIDADMLWWNQLILFAMSFTCCFLTYLQLRRVKKDK
ncbi:ATP-binding cassette sub-family G member 2-like isoform X2 [Dendronephthya gigantea]|uniref:ATP-binding cassette sub-family G member 2-like isoform X2 n=1 Tax=Dendronephthya gigantea TaxID=151771 RepID=UPI00106C4E8D|nr:ATP-binding cassette sub-family G member 2-like isoform X2 [Dendronephthya gigantea]